MLAAESTARPSGGAGKGSDGLISRTFRSYLALSILITLSATLGMMIDNVIAGNLLGPDAMAAIGMSLSVFMLFAAAAGILETGAVALAARALGARDSERVNVLFSVTIAAAFVIGLAVSLATVFGAEPIARALGATEGVLLQNTADYLAGIGVGACFIVMLQVMMGFSRLDNAPQLGLASIIIMSVSDVVLNLVAVLVFDMGIRGMGLATSLAYLLALLTCSSHLVSKKNTLRFVNPLGHLSALGEVLKTGLPDSLTRLCVMARTFTYNHLLLMVAGAGAVTALSLLSSVNSFMSSVTVGVGQTATLLCGIFFGERDREALKSTLKVGLRTGVVLCCVIAAAVFAFAESVVQVFGIAPGEDSFAFAVVAVRAFCLVVPIDLVNSLFVSFYQSTGNLKAANLVTAGQSFVMPAIFAVCTVWFWGAYGVWLSFLVGELIVLAVQIALASVLWARRRADAKAAQAKASLLEKMMYLPEGFQSDWRSSLSLSCGADLAEVNESSRMVAAWCLESGIDKRRAYLLSLAVEEMAGNIVKHGFKKTKRPSIEVKAIALKDGTLILRLRDNGREFNPLDYDIQADDAYACIGIRLIRRAITNISYQNVVGLNNLVITL